MASYDPSHPVDSVRNRGLRPDAPQKAIYVVQLQRGDEFEIKGDMYVVDCNQLTVIADGGEVASFNNWSSIRVKDAA